MVNASLVKALREKTGVGMMHCKEALMENNGDFDSAVDWLRKKGIATAAKKADRTTTDGLVAIAIKDDTAVTVEINSETDFVARNVVFQTLVNDIAQTAIKCENLNALQSATITTGKSVANEIAEKIAVIGENITLRRMHSIKINKGVIASYVHNSVTENIGKIAVIIGIESEADQSKLKALGKQIAMHIAAMKPQGLDRDDIDPVLVQSERDIFFEQSRASGKTDNIIEKMVEGRIKKFFAEVVLLEQIFVIDGKSKISDIIKNAENELGTSIKISKFVRYECGEDI